MFLGHDRVVYLYRKKKKISKNNRWPCFVGSVTLVGKEFYPRFISRIMIVLNSFCILCKLLVNAYGGYGPPLKQMTEQ